MSNILNQDFEEFISAFNRNDVKYILVGGYAVIFHGYVRTTGDIDLWVKKDEGNYNKIFKAFHDFGMPLFDLTKENFLYNENMDVFTYGRPPVSIDVVTSIKGLNFDESYQNSIIKNIDGVNIRTVSLDDLRKAKKAAGRPRDINDLENLK